MAGENEALSGLGLTQNEAKLYLLLLKGGKAKATELAANSGMHRRVVYDTLAQLAKKGMVGTAAVGGVLTFTPSPPSSLLSFLDEKRDAMEKALPSLARVFESEKATSASVMHGRQGVKTVLEDILALRADYCVYYGAMQIYDILPKFMSIFNEKRKRLGIKGRHILLDSPLVRERAGKVPLSESKFIDPSAPDSERYKMVFMGGGGPNGDYFKHYLETRPDDVDPVLWRRGSLAAIYGATSPDGLHWTLIEEPLVITMADTAQRTLLSHPRSAVAAAESWPDSREASCHFLNG